VEQVKHNWPTRSGFNDSVELGDIAIQSGLECLPNLQACNAITETRPVYSLIGAALLRTGWSGACPSKAADVGIFKSPRSEV